MSGNLSQTLDCTMQFFIMISATMVWGFLVVAAAPIVMLDDSLISATGSPAPIVVAGRSPHTIKVAKDTFTPASKVNTEAWHVLRRVRMLVCSTTASLR
ncbi:uncharacterized protein SCHCODRAFT_01352774 [Schizophyllum commune H4-8]|nr:uncharacterized protein SCHCODRAFT_01352774 [Schizophyllum commune H4-8]KAI5892400.1 hypothetical protein SCHCODRAFT_01352774 [Schizophyllum commune H4-8]